MQASLQTATVSTYGDLQRIDLPKSCHFKSHKVVVKPLSVGVLLLPIDSPYAIMQSAINEFENGFTMEREIN